MECVNAEAENRVQVPQTLVLVANVFVGVVHPAVYPLAIVVKEVGVFAESIFRVILLASHLYVWMMTFKSRQDLILRHHVK